MILDTSAIVELILGHPEAENIERALEAASSVGVGAPTLVEASIVLRVRLAQDPEPILSRFIEAYDVEVIAFGDAHWREASAAFQRFGKGRHAARLNYGDCLSYAAARVADMPLLYIGDDFAQTDLGRT